MLRHGVGFVPLLCLLLFPCFEILDGASFRELPRRGLIEKGNLSFRKLPNMGPFASTGFLIGRPALTITTGVLFEAHLKEDDTSI